MKISVVIPCYNSQETISRLINEIIEVINERRHSFEIILIDDSSQDNTWLMIEKICERHVNVKGILLSRNFGQHVAIMAGFRHVTGDVVCCLDDDGQTPPSEIYKLIDNLDTHDIVMARYKKKKHNFFRNLYSRINDIMAIYLINKPKKLYVTSFFACKKYVIEEIIKYKKPFPYLLALLLPISGIVNIDVEHKERRKGRSGYTFTKLISLWLNCITAISSFSLRVIIFIGMVIALMGFMYGGYILVRWLLSTAVSLMSLSLIVVVSILFSGITILLLGIIKDYIGRNFMCFNSSPQFIISKSINLK